MKWLFTLLMGFMAIFTYGQNSLLVNFGSNTCVAPAQPSLSVIKNPLGIQPTVLARCGLSNQLPDFFGVFVAYNPSDNRIYLSDVRTFSQSRIWRLDLGLPDSIRCPANTAAQPDIVLNYVSNNFEFDNSGNLWSFSSYNPSTGQCRLDQLDLQTGQVAGSRTIQFPNGNFPTSITSGDLCILPNGRMFATLGSNPSRLYEIAGYAHADTVVNARFLQVLPKNCYGIAYLNGLLEITGTDIFSSCYYFTYDIAAETLAAEKPFQNGLGPIDNTSITPAIGATKRLVEASLINANTAIITYEIHVRNMGNTVLNDVNIREDLASTFGSAVILGAYPSFVQGANAAGLQLNPAFNGTSQTALLKANQSIPNFTGKNQNYFTTLRLQVVVTNLQAGKVYLNSAIAQATINSAQESILITDTSNNGMPDAIDPNLNGNPAEAGENEPTPFSFGLLPVTFLQVEGMLATPVQTRLDWAVAVPVTNADYFEVQWSLDAQQWQPVEKISITSPTQSRYRYLHRHHGPQELFYRIRQADKDGSMIYSKVIRLQQSAPPAIHIFPNPAKGFINLSLGNTPAHPLQVNISDVQGRLHMQFRVQTIQTTLPLEKLPPGHYFLQVNYGGQWITQPFIRLP